MKSARTSPGWKQWLSLGRLVPLLTILGAGIAIVLSLLNLIQLTVSEEIIIALLALVGVDALNERLGLLERVQARLDDLSAQIGQLPFADIKFENRDALSGSLEGTLKDAHHLDILGLTLLGVITNSLGCFDRMAANPSCRLRFLIVKPGSAAMDSAVGFIEDKEQRERDLWAATRRLKRMSQRDNVHLKFTSVAPSFSLVIVDPRELGGRTQVELYGCGITPDERPHFTLTRENQPWYDFFTQQFEKFWQEAQTLEEVEEELKRAEVA